MPASFFGLLRHARSHLCVAAQMVPRFRHYELTTPEAVLNLPGEIVSGHSDRHVVRVALGQSKRPLTAYLKREHRVRWRDRLRSWIQGMGWASLSTREARVLAALQRIGVPGPRVLACGESQGRAFLLVQAAPGAIDLRQFLHRMGAAVPLHRRAAAARKLGTILARLHGAGYDAPDLLSKHILIHVRHLGMTLVDCARMQLRRYISPRRAARDLGRLDASLADSLATPSDRLRCIHSYWRSRGGGEFAKFSELVRLCGTQGRRAQRRRSVRELRRAPVDESGQQLRWLDGEALCATRDFWRSCRGAIPSWLWTMARSLVSKPTIDPVFWNGRRLALQRWPAASRWCRAAARVLGHRVETNWTRRAGALFRLRRHGIAGPRVLAFGRRPDGSGFLLTRPISDTFPIANWMAQSAERPPAVFRRIGRLLRRLHDAGERFGRTDESLHITVRGRVVLSAGHALRPMPRPPGRWPFRDLAAALRHWKLNSRDAALLVRGYLGASASIADGRRLASDLRGGLPIQRSSRDV